MSIQPVSSRSNKQNRPRRGLAFRMISLLLPVTIIPTLLMGITVYFRARNLMLQQVSTQMDTFLIESTNQLDSWILDKTLAFDSLLRNEEFITSVESYTLLGEDSPSRQNLRNDTIAIIRQVNTPGETSLFNNLFLVSPSGEILLSTNRSWEGARINDQPYFQTKINTSVKASFLEVKPSLIYDPDSAPEYEIIHVMSVPVTGKNGSMLGYLAGISDGRAVQTILEANASFLPNNNLFMLTEDQKFAGITDVTKSLSLRELQPSSDQMETIFNGQSGTNLAASYQSFDNTPVLGIYRFYEALNTGFLVEVPEADILGTINSLAPTSILIMAVTVLAISALVYLAIRQITIPLQELAQVTQDFSHGNWDSRSTYSSKDEIGTLSSSFNQMADDLSHLYTEMESQVEERTRQVIATSEVSSMATSAVSMDELLDRTTDLISDRFKYFHIAIYILNSDHTEGELRAASGEVGRQLLRQGHQIRIHGHPLYEEAIQTNMFASMILDDGETANENYDMQAEARSKIVIPISFGKDVIGLIDVQSKDPAAFTQASAEVLTTLANQLAAGVYNFQLREGSQVDLRQINQLYATSQRLSQATTADEVFNAIAAGVQQTSLFAAVYRPFGSHMELVSPPDQAKPYYADQLPGTLNVSSSLAATFFPTPSPVVIKDVNDTLIPMRPELLYPARALDAREASLVPILINNQLQGVILLASRESETFTLESLKPFRSLADLAQTSLLKISIEQQKDTDLDYLNLLTKFHKNISKQYTARKLYPAIHQQINELLGNTDFFIALYDEATDRIEIPYLYEGGAPISIEPFPLGEGLSSIVIRTKQPLFLIENVEERAKALGAKIVGQSAKSWIGIPLLVDERVIGVLSVQDVENENRFSQKDLDLLLTLSPSIASAIHSTTKLSEAEKRAFQLETSAEIAREASQSLNQQELLRYTLQLIQERFNFYHASIFLVDPSGEYAVVEESTGEAGKKMKGEGHKLAIGSKSIIGTVTATKEPVVVNDVTKDPTHRFNPLLPDTRAEAGIPILLGDQVLGALDVQATTPFAFSMDDVEVLQILANQLAVAINNATLFAETQEHLAQHRLVHHITTVASTSQNIEDALSSAVQGLRVTLGDNVSILLLDKQADLLTVVASSGYDNTVDGMQIRVGEGLTGWVAAHNEPLIVNDVANDSRYIPGKEGVRSEIVVPLTYRSDLLGVLNVESEHLHAYTEYDQDILGTLAGSLAGIIINARMAERQKNLFEITNKIRQSVNMDTILETTATELARALQARRARIEVGGDLVQNPEDSNGNTNRGSTRFNKESR
ncbi:MAG: GAF domain-containing protein [Anaerolineales bacterium]|nr:GAF domain-containing protein [Anaerolineales bacterium]